MISLEELLHRADITKPTSHTLMHSFIKDPTPLSRKQICDKLNLKRTTAYDGLKPLFKKGLIQRIKRLNNQGRPTILFKPNSEFFC